MPVTAKICGLSTPETLDAAISGGASHVGFVFFPKSPRHISLETAAMLAARVPRHVRRVGVFVGRDSQLFDDAIAAAGLHILQLHDVLPHEASHERARTGRAVWGVLPVRTAGNLRNAKQFAGAVDRLLYDAKPPEGAELPGGMGLRFDWNLLAGFDHPLPWALAGGLDANNVAEAVRITNARKVDVSSGVESAPGIKDVAKIAAFLATVKTL